MVVGRVQLIKAIRALTRLVTVTTVTKSERTIGDLKRSPPRGKPGTDPGNVPPGNCSGALSTPTASGQIAGKSPEQRKTTTPTVGVPPSRPMVKAVKRSSAVLEAPDTYVEPDDKRTRLGGPAPGFVLTSERGRVAWEEIIAARQRLFTFLEQKSKRIAIHRRQEFHAIVDSVFETLTGVVGEERKAVKTVEVKRDKVADISPPKSGSRKPQAPPAKKAKNSPQARIDRAEPGDEKSALAPQAKQPREKKQGAPQTWTEVVKRKNCRPPTVAETAKKGPIAQSKPVRLPPRGTRTRQNAALNERTNSRCCH